MSKGDYARRKHRSPACVSGWIKAGKISAAALVGDGQAAKIWVEQADADLAASLHPSQQWAQEHPANEPSGWMQDLERHKGRLR
ncbi:hypothetical protein [Bradyrhizobium huanghuaihaiense]